MPNINELRSIVDYTRHDPAINTSIFQYTSSSMYWSSTTYAEETRLHNALTVDFDKGLTDGDDKYTGRHHLRCVRGGQIRTSSTINPGIIMYLLN